MDEKSEEIYNNAPVIKTDENSEETRKKTPVIKTDENQETICKPLNIKTVDNQEQIKKEETNKSPKTQWTKEHEEILKEWKAKAFVYLWLQTKSCYHFLRINNWLSYTIIILSSIASATMFSIGSTEGTNTIGIPIYVIQYITGLLTLLSAIFTGILRQLKPGEMYQEHANVAKKYNNLIRSIDVCLSLTSGLRSNPVTFIERTCTELDHLANTQIEPPRNIIRNFEKIYGPLERVLYGEDIVELRKITYETDKLEKKMRKFFLSTSGLERNELRLTPKSNKKEPNRVSFDINTSDSNEEVVINIDK